MTTTPIISAQHLCKRFGSKIILDDFSLDIMEGETMTILGGSGTGKSVTLKIILGLLAPDAGDVFFRGESVCAMDERALCEMRQQVGMLFQGGALFDSLTVRENIAYPLRVHFAYDEEKISGIVANRLEMVGLPHTESMMPADLSGGMRKRIALARAIAIQPAVILYDEPTTGLDPSNTRRINLLMRTLQRRLKVTSIVVTHDMQSAFMVTDRIALLYDHRVEFVGTVAEARTTTNENLQGFIRGELIDEVERSIVM